MNAERGDLVLLLGIVVIVGSGLYVFRRERGLARHAGPPP